jgi:single-stranded DNA-binding protein
MRVVVSGRIEQRSWETEDGEHRSKVFSELRDARKRVQLVSRHAMCGVL